MKRTNCNLLAFNLLYAILGLIATKLHLYLNKKYKLNLVKICSFKISSLLKIKKMCKKCEIQGIKMTLNFLEIPSFLEMKGYLSTEVKAWKSLFDSGWEEEDLTSRAYAHLKWTERESVKCNQPHWVGNAKAFLSSMAKGFASPFNKQSFMPQKGDANFTFKVNVLEAIQDAADFYGNRVSSVLWDSFAYLGTRENPEISRSILKEANELPHHYGIVDTMLHASAKCYKLLLTVQSFMFKKTGMVIDHNCDCDCSLVNLLEGTGEMAVIFKIKPEQRHEATQSVFTHMLAESHLILNCKLPFEYTVTKESALLEGIEVENFESVEC